jgi:alkylation response protein AidB-like acyl-CoA dehydrogenase
MKFQEQIIKDEILEKMSLENVYKITNDNLFPILNEHERAFCKELQEFCLELRPKIDKSKDVYELFPVLGNEGYIQRINLFKDFRPYGMKTEVLLGTHLSCLDSQLELARLASGILCGNPTYHFFHHGHESEAIRRVQEGLISGKKIGCIGITEPERGSDAVNMTSKCTKTDDGVRFVGEKVYTTNGPKADYFCAYGCTNLANPRGTMIQAMISRDFGGITTNRLKIDYVPRVHIAHTFIDTNVPYDYILGDEGAGYKNLFEGLVPERLGIMGSGLGICWAALAYGIIYTNLRLQFGQPIIKYQGVGFSLADLLSRTSAATALALQAASVYDEHILFSEKPSKQAEKWVAAISSQGKYLVAKLSADVTYTVQQQMGGISVTDNTDVQELASTSNIEEVIGGSRNIQLFIIQNLLRRYLNQF